MTFTDARYYTMYTKKKYGDMMLKIAICDDEPKILDELAVKIENIFSEKEKTEIYKTSNPFDLLKHLNDNHTDVLFLDIDMPNLSGMDIAEKLLDGSTDTLLIFVTSHDALVYKSFRYHPFSFIRKSHFDEEIASVADSIIKKFGKNREVFSFKTSDGMYRINIAEILYFESDSNYLQLHTNKEIYRFRGTISSLEKELLKKGFIRTHKGFLVNQQHIYAVKGDDIQLYNNELLPIGRTNKDSVKRAIMRYMR